MLLKILPARTWLYGFLIMFGLSLFFYAVLGWGAKHSITQQVLKREQTLVRAQAGNITSFFQIFGESIAIFSHLSSLNERNEETIQDMDAFMDKWGDRGLVAGIVLTDSDGVVRFNSNVSGTRDLGASLADRGYFAWAQDSTSRETYIIGEPVVSKLGASKGQVIVPVVSPIYLDESFSGVVAASVILKPLTERNLDLLRVSDETNVYLVDQSGNILYNSSTPSFLGANIFNDFEDNLFTRSQALDDLVRNIFSKTEAGKLRIQDQLVAFSPVVLSNQKWLLVTASPSREVNDVLNPIYLRQTSVLVVTFLTFMLFGIIAARSKS